MFSELLMLIAVIFSLGCALGTVAAVAWLILVGNK
jgi:hypothetical protein